ncbi:MAG: chemotaxis protein CheA [Candidatus Magnetoovum sp. WYHC-5]|nr:chemotaxis protein CheA [Candidatus Magnetoovum sp. WYHC-5]
MNGGLDQAIEAYKEEAQELLSELETSLLELEESPEDIELISRVFRAMHTIKGSGAMFGFDKIAHFTHEVETAFDLVRNGQLSVTKELINLTLLARDQIRAMLEEYGGGARIDESKSAEIIKGFKRIMQKVEGGTEGAESAASAKAGSEADESDEAKSVTYRVRFKPDHDLFMSGTNPVLLLNELRELGQTIVIAQTQDIPILKELEPEKCYTFWDVILTTDKGINAIKDVFVFIEDSSDISIDEIDSGEDVDELGENYKKLGEILVERGDVKTDDLRKVLGKQKKVGEILVESGVVNEDQVRSALAEQKQVKQVRESKQKMEAASASIRVPSEKLDSLVDLVGELVTVQARLSQVSSSRHDANLTSIAEEVERLTWELRDSTMGIRMLPIGSTFSKFKRLVRDLSLELGKDIAMTTEGAETELDKTVIERLNDPLVHIIRNSIDHGIESPEDRVKKGKPKEGTIHLTAQHSGASVLITIRDDGKGLDKEAIVNKAIKNELVAPDAVLSEKEIFALIFEPGFSTAQKLTSVSGRGVGMDVVKRNIDALRGNIDVKSTKDKGTTITLKLPLTLAIIDGLLVKVETEFFVLPLSLVEECVELTKEVIDKAHGRHVANVREEIVPYIRIREFFNITGKSPEIEQIVIVEVEDHRVGFVVDYVIGEHQTVIKSLGKVYRGVEGVSGATILGDGTVALILDVPKLVKAVEIEENQTMVPQLS